MPNITPYIKKDFRFHISAVRQNKAYINDLEAFKPHGVQIFYGEQGSGKTITAVDFLYKVHAHYPKAVIVSNIVLNGMNKLDFSGSKEELVQILNNGFSTTQDYIFYSTKKEYELVNICVRNGKYGVILVTDEYQNYFSNQDSRNVPPWVIEQAAQNRKQARLHICTSQDYDQIIKATRRRADTALKCRTYSLPFSKGPVLTVFWAYDAKKIDFDATGRQIGAKPLKFGFYFHSKQLRDSFDTYQVVFTGDEATNVYTPFNQAINLRIDPSTSKAKRKLRR